MVFTRYRLWISALVQALALLCAPLAQAAPTHIAAGLVAESAGRPGETVTLALRMVPAEGWHGYWQNPGDAGLGVTLDWQQPAGSGAGELEYPVPGTLLASGLMNHVYNSEYALFVPYAVPADARPGSRIALAVKAQWLACTEKICVPEEAMLSTGIDVVAPGAALRRDPRFDGWRARMPAPLGSRATFALDGNRLRIAVPLPASAAIEAPHFFIAEDRIADYASPQRFARKDDVLLIELARAKFAPVTPTALSGVLRLNPAGDGVRFEAVPGAVPAGGVPLAEPWGSAPAALPWLLLGALLGGLLLNVMPCVFPILSLKAISLARASESEAGARAEGLAYAAGVILACVALGAVLLVLRTGGAQVGWAFQLQEPVVVAGLLVLAAAITANLVGLYEFAVPGFAQAGHARNNAFATGLLAAFVATPCTGPFMAAAMGAALLLPVMQALLLFATLGLGIALPFIAVAFVPALRRRLPKPGAWMVRLRRWMALPMGLTALALAWLASRIGGMTFAGAAIGLALLVLVLLALAGRAQRAGRSAMIAGLGALVLAGVALPLTDRLAAAPGAEVESLLPVKPFSEAALAEARASGKPVFAWFTADWCLTCKVNEKVAIERESTRDAFARAGVLVLRGDWTRRDPAITRYLTAHGAAGVPLYVWYPAGGGEGEILPQVLTPDLLAERAEAR